MGLGLSLLSLSLVDLVRLSKLNGLGLDFLEALAGLS